jgi:hypothetical protein
MPSPLLVFHEIALMLGAERFTGSTRSITVAESETKFAASVNRFEILKFSKITI